MRNLERLLERLEKQKTNFAPGNATRVQRLLAEIARHDFRDPQKLIRFHDALLFLRAYPHDLEVMRAAQKLLDTFVERVRRLRDSGTDMSVFDPEEVSGIAGTTLRDRWNYHVSLWLARNFPRQVSIDWENYDEQSRMGITLPRFVPMLADDADVEADVPYCRWLAAPAGRLKSLPWLLDRFEQLPSSDAQKAELYSSLAMPLRWELNNVRASRTRNHRSVRPVFCHKEPLLRRSDISLERELASPLPLRRLSRAEGEKIHDLIREVMAVRYRELYGTTLADPRNMIEARPGRGTTIYIWGLPPDRRLPLRAYLAGFTLKNGVPINYIEGISLFEWMEVGFNTFYAYRDGESAWHYVQALRLLSQLHRVRCISVYPYQLGHGNEEAIASGAFWFYRKLGFHPGRADVRQLLEREEKKIASIPRYRTPARTLRKMAVGHMFYEPPGAETGSWNNFRVRNIGFAVNRYMAFRFGGDAGSFRRASAAVLARLLRLNLNRMSSVELATLETFAAMLALVPDLPRWSWEEKRKLAAIIRAKTGRDEAHYIRLLQSHTRLRAAILRLGS